MAQKDFTEMLFKDLCARQAFFFFPFQIDSFYSPKCQHLKISLMGAEAGAGVKTGVNKAQPCGRQALEASGRVVSLSLGPHWAPLSGQSHQARFQNK